MEREDIGKIGLRLSLGLVFLYFGLVQIISPDVWAAYVPDFISQIITNTNIVVILNGIFEITVGVFLLLGLYTRASALFLGIHLAIITIIVGFNPIGIADYGLAMAALAVFFNNEDPLCLDIKLERKEVK